MRGLGIFWLASMRVVISAAFIALLMRAMVPDGWMVMADPVTGHASLQPCTGRMVISLAGGTGAHAGHEGHQMADMAGSHDAHQGHHAQHGGGMSPQQTSAPDHGDHAVAPTCPFAMSSLVAETGEAFVLLEPHLPAAPDRAVPPARGPPVRRFIHAPLPARGPPSFV